MTIFPFSRIREIAKYHLRRRANHWHWSAHPGPSKGTHHDRRDTLGRDAMDAAASGSSTAGRERLQRTAKSCGPGAATVASIRSARAGSATVTKSAAHRGEHEANRKTIVRGKPA